MTILSTRNQSGIVYFKSQGVYFSNMFFAILHPSFVLILIYRIHIHIYYIVLQS